MLTGVLEETTDLFWRHFWRRRFAVFRFAFFFTGMFPMIFGVADGSFGTTASKGRKGSFATALFRTAGHSVLTFVFAGGK
jgi:hypothetical protein